VTIYKEDSNVILLKEVFNRVKWEDHNRALCFLDPYGLQLNWEVIQKAGELGSIEIFLNFPLMDMNMNIFWTNPSGVDSNQIDRMNKYWGDDSWRDCVYSPEQDLFGNTSLKKNEAIVIAKAFKERLKNVAGFKFVPDPIPMKNSKKGTVYYLFFASPNKTGNKIVKYIFTKYSRKGW
ncbi:MAG: three-Cys-motif partner protein TcmP, partial [Candidatus Zixiibacteriota bacterium]